MAPLWCHDVLAWIHRSYTSKGFPQANMSVNRMFCDPPRTRRMEALGSASLRPPSYFSCQFFVTWSLLAPTLFEVQQNIKPLSYNLATGSM
jgi:hypothetical protein